MSSIQSFPGQVIKCRAAVSYAVNEPLVVEEINVVPPKAGEVRIKIVSTGICHTDLVSMVGDYGEIFPLIFGHEGSGIVESVGEGVTSVSVGDHVIPSYMAQCDKCSNCKHPENNFCEKTKFTSSVQPGVLEDGTTRFSTLDGKPIYQFLNVGSFSEYTVVSEVFVVKINPAADLEKACLLGCGISTGYGNVFNVAKVKPDSSVGVWGLGGIGLAIVMSARLAGAKHIIGIDTNPDKFALAKKLGATDCVNPKDLDFDADKLQKYLTEEKYPGGLDYTFECIGNPRTMQASLQACRIGSGVNCLVGVVKEGTMWPIDPLHVILGITIKGSCFGGLKSKRDLPGVVDKYVNNEITLDDFISHRFKLDQINEAFDLLKQGKCLRSVVVF